MVNRSATWFLSVAIGATVIAVGMVAFMELLQGSQLSLWLHIPLTLIALGGISLGAAVAGIAYLEYRTRQTLGEQAK